MTGAAHPPGPRSQPPAPGVPHDFRFPTFERRQPAGGPSLLTARIDRAPMVVLELLAPAGGHFQPPGAHGLASLAAALIDEGTAESSASDLAARVDRLGTSLVCGADWHVGYLSLSLLSGYLEQGLELLCEVASRATFPPEEVERLRRERLAELLRRRDQPDALGDDRLLGVLYGAGAYGTPLLGTEAAVRGFGRDNLVSFYRDHYHLRGMTLIAVGDLDPDDLAARIEGMCNGLAGTVPELVETAAEPLPRDGITVHIVDRPGAAQTELRLGQASISRLHPDFLPLMVTNTLFGGKFTSRINLNLRERHGYTYGAHSHLVPRRGPAPWRVKAAVATEAAGAAAREVLAELRRLHEETVGAAELEDTKSYLTGVFPYTLQSLEGVAQRLENLEVFGLPDDHYERYLNEIRAVDEEAVREAARRHLRPERLAVVAVGPVGELRPQFEGLGPVEVVEPEP